MDMKVFEFYPNPESITGYKDMTFTGKTAIRYLFEMKKELAELKKQNQWSIASEVDENPDSMELCVIKKGNMYRVANNIDDDLWMLVDSNIGIQNIDKFFVLPPITED